MGDRVAVAVDPDFYRLQIDRSSQSLDASSHYRRTGWKNNLDPNPLFSTRFYHLMHPETAGECPAEITGSAKRRTSVPAVFDPLFYAKQIRASGMSDAQLARHYDQWGQRDGYSPTALFDPSYYKNQLAREIGIEPAAGDLFEHYVTVGWQKGLSPHRLFDTNFYINQVTLSERICPLIHYLVKGWKTNASPHPLFDAEYYNYIEGDLDEAALVHYIKRELPDGTPHFLFSDSYYTKHAKENSRLRKPGCYTGGPPLVHYVTHGERAGIPPHPLFDVQHYQAAVEKWRRRSTRSNLPHEPTQHLGLTHYCKFGSRENLSPSPFLWLDHLREQLRLPINENPIRAYFLGGFRTASPHPALDLEHYVANAADLPPDLPSILHLLAVQKQHRTSPNPIFDPETYLAENEDVRSHDLCPILHFLEYGWRELRRPNALFSPRYAHATAARAEKGFPYPVASYFGLKRYRKPAILFLGHDASRTGAPQILLRLIRDISDDDRYECYTILGAGGPLTDEFSRYSHCYVMRHADRGFLDWYTHSSGFKKEIDRLDDVLRGVDVIGVVCNSLESRHLADYLSRCGYGPLTTLIHEAADAYYTRPIQDIISASQEVIFPSRYTLERTQKKCLLPVDSVHILPQGLLVDGFGTGSRIAAQKRVARELRLPDGCRIVLGCGTVNRRKGIDLFVEAAIRVLRKQKHDDVRFIWVGDGPAHYDSAYWWASRQIEEAELGDFIKIIGEREDTEPYFLAADLFLLTSRIDPMPCVVHEAMASGLPIVAIAGNSGAAEYAEGACIEVEEDAADIGEAVLTLLGDRLRLAKMGIDARSLIASKGSFCSYSRRIMEFIEHRGTQTDAATRSAHRNADTRTVYFLAADWQISGVNTFTLELIKELRIRGFDAKILFTRGMHTYHTDNDLESFPEIPYEFIQPTSTHHKDVWAAIKRYFLANRNRCVVIPNHDFLSSAIFPALPDHVRFVGIVHSDDPEHYEHAYRLGHYWDRVVCVSNTIHRRVFEYNGSLIDKTVTIPYGIRVDPINSIAARPKSIRDKTLRLIYVGRIVQKQKKIMNYAALVRRLEKQGVNYHMTFVGDGEMESTLKGDLADLVEAGKVTMSGRLSPADATAALAQSDILLLLSEFEGLPLALLEAMAVGCVPVVWRTESGIDQVIRTGVNGIILEQGDIPGVAETLREFERNRRHLHAMKRNAQESFMASNFRIEKAADQYASVLEEIFRNKDLPPRPPAFTEDGIMPPVWMKGVN